MSNGASLFKNVSMVAPHVDYADYAKRWLSSLREEHEIVARDAEKDARALTEKIVEYVRCVHLKPTETAEGMRVLDSILSPNWELDTEKDLLDSRVSALGDLNAYKGGLRSPSANLSAANELREKLYPMVLLGYLARSARGKVVAAYRHVEQGVRCVDLYPVGWTEFDVGILQKALENEPDEEDMDSSAERLAARIECSVYRTLLLERVFEEMLFYSFTDECLRKMMHECVVSPEVLAKQGHLEDVYNLHAAQKEYFYRLREVNMTWMKKYCVSLIEATYQVFTKHVQRRDRLLDVADVLRDLAVHVEDADPDEPESEPEYSPSAPEDDVEPAAKRARAEV